MRFVLLLLAVSGCTPTPPLVPSPDASDASAFGDAVPSIADGGFTGPCAPACNAMVKAGCVVRTDCAAVLQSKTSARDIRNAATGNALTCDDVAKVKTAQDVAALGQPCGPVAP